MSAADRAKADYSKGKSGSWADSEAHPAVHAGLVAVAAIGALLLIVSEFQTLYTVTVGTVVKKTVSGHSQHSFSLLVIGLAALPLAFASAPRRNSRPAMAALALLGVVAVLIALIGDLPDVSSTGLIGQLYAEASASAKIGFYMETLGAVALIFSGASMLLLSGIKRPERTVVRRRTSAGQPTSTTPVDAEDAGWL